MPSQAFQDAAPQKVRLVSATAAVTSTRASAHSAAMRSARLQRCQSRLRSCQELGGMRCGGVYCGRAGVAKYRPWQLSRLLRHEKALTPAPSLQFVSNLTVKHLLPDCGSDGAQG